jgi:hypothetical protein
MESKALSIEVHSTAFLQQSESNTSLADKRSPHFAYRFTKDAARSSRDSNPSLITRACTPLTTSKFPNSTAAAVRLTSTTESLLRSVFRIRGGVEGVVVEEGLLEAGHAAEGGERAGEAVPLEAEAPERGEVGKGGGELAGEAELLEVEVVDPAGLVAGDVRPRAGVGVVGPAEHVGVGQGLAEVLQHCEVGGVRGRGRHRGGEDGEEEAHDNRGVHLSGPFPSRSADGGRKGKESAFFPPLSSPLSPSFLACTHLLLLLLPYHSLTRYQWKDR